jgi:hypothetical protein
VPSASSFLTFNAKSVDMALMLRANIPYHMFVNLAGKNETVIKPQVRSWNPRLNRRRG